MRISILRLREGAILPTYAHGPLEDAGMDLYAIEPALLPPGMAVAVGTGLAIELPLGYEAQIRPRSSLALRHAITLPNSPGTIDPGYRGEIQVVMLNLGTVEYQVSAGDRIAQMVVARFETVEWEEADLAESKRGSGGFGSSGR